MDPKIRFGKPCIAGTRIDVAAVIAGLASKASEGELTSEYQLTREQISTALRFAAPSKEFSLKSRAILNRSLK